MIDGYVPEGRRNILYVRISELPAYLVEPFKEFTRGHTVLVLSGAEQYGTDLAYASDFEAFCAEKGIKIKLASRSI